MALNPLRLKPIIDNHEQVLSAEVTEDGEGLKVLYKLEETFPEGVPAVVQECGYCMTNMMLVTEGEEMGVTFRQIDE